jgi:hypothetical protein
MKALAMAVLLLAAPVLAAPHVSQVLSARQARLGEPIDLDVTIVHERGEKYELVLPEQLGAFSVLGQSQRTAPEASGEVTHLKVKLGVYGTGKNLLPALAVRETRTGITTALPQDAEVETVSTLTPDDPLTLRDVAPPRQPFVLDPLKVAAAVIGVLATGALIVLGARLFMRLRKPESEEARDKRLLATLEGVADEPFYETLDGILRRTLARSYGVPAIERTSEEIVGAVTAKPPPGLTPDEIANVLRESVWVRFAHRPSTGPRKQAALDVCQRLLFPPQPRGEPDARAALS